MIGYLLDTNHLETKIMFQGPIVEEVRHARERYAKRFNYDLDAICRDLQEKQRKGERKIVSFPPQTY